MKVLIIALILMSVGTAQAQKRNVRYEYKKYEKFDFEEIGVEGVAGSPGEISVSPRLRKEFKNRVPERRNFNKEMKIAIEGIR